MTKDITVTFTIDGDKDAFYNVINSLISEQFVGEDDYNNADITGYIKLAPDDQSSESDKLWSILHIGISYIKELHGYPKIDDLPVLDSEIGKAAEHILKVFHPVIRMDD